MIDTRLKVIITKVLSATAEKELQKFLRENFNPMLMLLCYNYNKAYKHLQVVAELRYSFENGLKSNYYRNRLRSLLQREINDSEFKRFQKQERINLYLADIKKLLSLIENSENITIFNTKDTEGYWLPRNENDLKIYDQLYDNLFAYTKAFFKRENDSFNNMDYTIFVGSSENTFHIYYELTSKLNKYNKEHNNCITDFLSKSFNSKVSDKYRLAGRQKYILQFDIPFDKVFNILAMLKISN